MNYKAKKTRVMVVAAECRPFVKVGGLGDMVSLIVKELKNAGFDILLVLPGYSQVKDKLRNLTACYVDPTTGFSGEILSTIHEGVEIAIISNDTVFKPGDGPYSSEGIEHSDIAGRFAFLCCATAHIADGLTSLKRPDVIHLHDWHTCLTALYIKSAQRPPIFLSIHNFAFQGRISRATARSLGVPSKYLTDPHFDFFQGISLMHIGMAEADIISTVSEDYALSLRRKTRWSWWYVPPFIDPANIIGIDNWIDNESWQLPADNAPGFSCESTQIVKRKENRASLFAKFGWTDDDAPLFCTVSRITKQKGFAFLLKHINFLIGLGCRIIFVGDGNIKLLNRMRTIQRKFPNQIGLISPYSENDAKLVLSSSDFCLMPSLVEPCGLTQRHARALGCIPIISDVYGLRSTVRDGITGFAFQPSDHRSFKETIGRALTIRDSSAWKNMQISCIQEEKRPSRIEKYIDIINYLSKNPLNNSVNIGIIEDEIQKRFSRV